MSSRAFFDSFEYLCYGANAIINMFTLTVRGGGGGGGLQSSESDVYRRQILTTKVDPRAVRVIPLSATKVVSSRLYLVV